MIFATWIVAALATVSAVAAVATGQAAGFAVQLALWLWATVLFANVAESIAEGRGKAVMAEISRQVAMLKRDLVLQGNLNTLRYTG